MASQADLETELLIRGRLDARFPEDAFLGEETGATDFADGQGIWVVDPIDGTQPYVSGLPSWCVSIGFVRDGAILFGMVYAPVARRALRRRGRDSGDAERRAGRAASGAVDPRRDHRRSAIRRGSPPARVPADVRALHRARAACTTATARGR